MFGFGYPSWPPTGLSAGQPPPLTCVNYATSHYKENYFVCLFTVAFLSITVWVFFLAIPHGMNLVVPTNISFFWVVCHPSKTFPPKEFEWEPQNRLSLLPTVRSYPLLPLTHDPPLLYWLGTGWWYLSLMRAPLPCVSKACLLLMRLPWLKGLSVCFVAHFEPSFFMACFLQRLGLAWLWALLFLTHSLLLLWIC